MYHRLVFLYTFTTYVTTYNVVWFILYFYANEIKLHATLLVFFLMFLRFIHIVQVSVPLWLHTLYYMTTLYIPHFFPIHRHELLPEILFSCFSVTNNAYKHFCTCSLKDWIIVTQYIFSYKYKIFQSNLHANYTFASKI